MTRQGTMFKKRQIQTQETKRITQSAEYEAVKARGPYFGMSERERFVLRRGANRDLVTQQHTETIEARKRDDGRGLKGQTIACAVAAKDVADGLMAISPSGIKKWKGMCRYFCIAITETHESFWWNIDTLHDMVDGCMEGVPVELTSAQEYHRPINVPLGWPWGKSPMEKLGLDYMDSPGRVCLTDGCYVRAGWTGWGNLHPSGGEAEGTYVK